MKHYQLKKKQTGQILFEGLFNTIKECLEDAVTRQIDLIGVELENSNLSGINLDGANLFQASLKNCNLTGANISEAQCTEAEIINCDLTAACLAYSHFQGTSFYETSFGSTDLAGSHIENCVFSCPSCFSNNFSQTKIFKNCYYVHSNTEYCELERPPIVMTGLPYEVVFMSRHMKVGCVVREYQDITRFNARMIEKIYGSEARVFFEQYKNFLGNVKCSTDQAALTSES